MTKHTIARHCEGSCPKQSPQNAVRLLRWARTQSRNDKKRDCFASFFATPCNDKKITPNTTLPQGTYTIKVVGKIKFPNKC